MFEVTDVSNDTTTPEMKNMSQSPETNTMRYTIEAVILLTIAFLGILLNGLTVVVLGTTKQKKVDIYLLITLSSFDRVQSLGLLEKGLRLSIFCAEGRYAFVDMASCIVEIMLNHFPLTAGIGTLTTIAVNRYAVVLHTAFQRKYINHPATIGVLISIIVLAALNFSLGGILYQWNIFFFHPEFLLCVLWGPSIKLQEGIFFFAPMIVMVLVYGRIYVFYCRQNRRVQNTLNNGPGQLETAAGRKQRAQNMRLIKTMVTILGMYILCFFPYVLVITILDRRDWYPVTIALVIMPLTSIIDPIVYILMNREMQRRIRKLFGMSSVNEERVRTVHIQQA